MSKGRENKPHIGIYGRRNYGKSSFLNMLTGQYIAIVSEHPGTTTDPVKKSIELPGVGPAIIIDTAGYDDTGDLGSKRIDKTLETLNIIDLAILIINNNELGDYEESIIGQFTDKAIPYIIIHGKSDIAPPDPYFIRRMEEKLNVPVITLSNNDETKLPELYRIIKSTIPETVYRQKSLLGNIIHEGDIILLIVPVDTEAPEGRLILPQVQVIRDILDNDCTAIVLKENETENFLKKTGIRPNLIICDTSVIGKAVLTVPEDIPLTGFSILLAYHKGDFENYVKGTPVLGMLKDGDNVLILESCTHHISCDDIGRFKLPRWIEKFTGRQLHFDIVAGLGKLNRSINDYAIVVQCGGCVITANQIRNRLKPAIDAGVPVTNYGMAIAYMEGLYDRAVAPFTSSINSLTVI